MPGPMPVPSWYARVRPHPDYDNARLILIDANVVIDLTNRGAWDDELTFVMNAPAERLRLKVNRQVWAELAGLTPRSSRMPAGALAAQLAFVDDYRRTGKIIRDDGDVPFFRPERRNAYRLLDTALATTGNLSAADRPTATDAIVNRIPLLTRDAAMRDGLSRALRNGAVRAVLRAHSELGLPTTLAEISLRD